MARLAAAELDKGSGVYRSWSVEAASRSVILIAPASQPSQECQSDRSDDRRNDAVKEAGLDGLLYRPLERPTGFCACILKGEALAERAIQRDHFKFLWNGQPRKHDLFVRLRRRVPSGRPARRGTDTGGVGIDCGLPSSN